MIKTTLKTILGLSLIAGCAGDDQDMKSPDSSDTQRRQQGVRSADATAKVLSLSNATFGAASSGTRSNLITDLPADVEASLADYLAGLENADCLDFSLNDIDATSVSVSMDFDNCLDAAGDIITGDFDVTVTLDGTDIDCDFDADLDIDGTVIDGNWSIDVDEAGTAIVDGAINIDFLDGTSLSALIDASWKDLGGECPMLEQHIEVTAAGETVSVDLSGLDLCSASFCGSDVDIQISDASGVAEVDFGSADITVEGLGDGFVCDANGNLDWDVDYQDEVDDALDEVDPLDGQDLPGN